MTKKIFIYFLLLTLSHCGFTPIYNSNNDLNYKLNVTKIKGDGFINNRILNEIKLISDENSSNELKLKINSKYEKKIVAKNSKGSPTEYELITNVEVIIENKNKETVKNFIEKQNLKNISDIFEQKNYENDIKTNFAISIVRNLGIELINNL